MNKELKNEMDNLLDNIDILQDLNGDLDKFNIFDVLKVSTTEIRHSNMLAWLFNPRETHSIGDEFLRRFIEYYIRQNNKCMKIKDFLIEDYSDFSVYREWNNIDILLVSNKNKLAICIENKIFSKESNHQLRKYLTLINKEYSEYNKAFIFLTPEGEDASDTKNWVSFDYSQIISILEDTIKAKGSCIESDVLSFLNQYINMVRREILMDKYLAEKCAEIYNKYPKALDLIFEYKQDVNLRIKNMLEDLLNKHENIIIDSSNRTFVRFLTTSMESKFDKFGEGWTKSNRILLYEFQNKNNGLSLKLVIGPTIEEKENIREDIFKLAQNNSDLFVDCTKRLCSKFTQIYARKVISKDIIESGNMDLIQDNIDRFMQRFIGEDMKEIDVRLQEIC